MPGALGQAGNRAVARLLAPAPPEGPTVQRTLLVDKDPYDDPVTALEVVLAKESGLQKNPLFVFERLATWIKDGKQFASWADMVAELKPASAANAKVSVLTLNGRVFVLVGTTHGREGPDLSGNVSPETLADSSVVVEYPPLPTGQDRFGEDVIKNISDNTQKSLVMSTAPRLELVGGDGRKTIEGGQVHGVSLRHRVDDPKVDDSLLATRSFTIKGGSSSDHKVVNQAKLETLITSFIEGSLGVSQIDRDTVLDGLSTMVDYDTGTPARLIMAKTFDKVLGLAGTLDLGSKKAVAAEVLGQYRKEIASAEDDYDYASGCESTTMMQGFITKANRDMASAALDAVCNVLLFTEVVVPTKKKKVVVAFGNEHLIPLKKLIARLKP